ncbi:MAG: hypothetical protein AAF754_14500, partial [Pseudomonadota bacterium]
NNCALACGKGRHQAGNFSITRAQLSHIGSTIGLKGWCLVSVKAVSRAVRTSPSAAVVMASA